MYQLVQKIGENYQEWSAGYGRFFEYGRRPGKIGVGVYCKIHQIPEDYVAMLDTAAEWPMVGGELAEELWNQLDRGETLKIEARGECLIGELRRSTITLRRAKDGGEDLTLDSTIWISKDWHGPIVLGYRGFLERLRFALDPGIRYGAQLFYYG